MSDRLATYRLAIQNEIMSQNLYRSLALSFAAHPEISQTLANLAPMEHMHEEKLRAACLMEFPGTTLEFDPGLQHKVKPEDLVGPYEVLEFAISREVIAAEIYYKMARETKDPDTAQFLRELSGEEELHKTVLETEILRLDGLITWFDPSELNGLVED
jgi:rubrerythrin